MRSALFRLLLPLVLVGGGVGGWYVLTHYEIRGLEQFKLVPRGEQASAPAPAPAAPATAPAPVVAPKRETFRIASFNVAQLDEVKFGSPRLREILGQILARFDIIALQDLHAKHQGLLVKLAEQASTSGRSYDFAVAPTVPLGSVQRFSAFLFDKSTIEVDRSMIYLVDDPARRLHCRPLVAAFRARGPAATEAFTFSLVAAEIDEETYPGELAAAAVAFRAVRDDGRNEDDVILLGTFNAPDGQLEPWASRAGLVMAITGAPTTTRGTRLADNLLFAPRATPEFTGRAGVIDVLREFNLTMPEALDLSEHLPVWAEFSVYEGGAAATAAPRM